jgi:hypothetical protein
MTLKTLYQKLHLTLSTISPRPIGVIMVVAYMFIAQVSPFIHQASAAAAIEPVQNFAIPAPLTNYDNAKSGKTFVQYFIFIWQILIAAGGLMVVLYFLQAAFEWLGAGGEAAKITKAREKMTGAVAGFLILIAMFGILSFIETIFGINILNPVLPTADDPRFK